MPCSQALQIPAKLIEGLTDAVEVVSERSSVTRESELSSLPPYKTKTRWVIMKDAFARTRARVLTWGHSFEFPSHKVLGDNIIPR